MKIINFGNIIKNENLTNISIEIDVDSIQKKYSKKYIENFKLIFLLSDILLKNDCLIINKKINCFNDLLIFKKKLIRKEKFNRLIY